MRWKVLVLFVVMAGTPAAADQWQRAVVTEVFSESRDFFVRVTPGDNFADLFGFTGCCPPGRNGQAEFYRRQPDRSYALIAQTELLNPVAPAEYHVSNEGRLLTFDNWHNIGYGNAVALYDADGSLIRSYTLSDLFSEEEIDAFAHSASSIHWRTGIPYFREQRDLLTHVAPQESGASAMFGLETGSYKFCETRDGAFRCRDRNDGRVWRDYADTPDPR